MLGEIGVIKIAVPLCGGRSLNDRSSSFCAHLEAIRLTGIKEASDRGTKSGYHKVLGERK